MVIIQPINSDKYIIYMYEIALYLSQYKMNIIDIAQISMLLYGLRTLQCKIFTHRECSHILIKLKNEFRIPKNMNNDASRGIVILYEQEK